MPVPVSPAAALRPAIRGAVRPLAVSWIALAALAGCSAKPLDFIPATDRALITAQSRMDTRDPNAGPISVAAMLQRVRGAGDATAAVPNVGPAAASAEAAVLRSPVREATRVVHAAPEPAEIRPVGAGAILATAPVPQRLADRAADRVPDRAVAPVAAPVAAPVVAAVRPPALPAFDFDDGRPAAAVPTPAPAPSASAITFTVALGPGGDVDPATVQAAIGFLAIASSRIDADLTAGGPNTEAAFTAARAVARAIGPDLDRVAVRLDPVLPPGRVAVTLRRAGDGTRP